MRSSSPLVRLLASRPPSLRARVGLLLAQGRRTIRPAHAYATRYGNGTIFLSHDDFDIDLRSLAFVVVDEPYRTDYAGAVVLDLGAHKGYYGAYALDRGARSVLSFEPERANLELLERAAASFGRDVWQVRDAAIGPARATAELHVMGASWGHALDPPESFSRHEVGMQSVRVDALSDVLSEAGASKDARSRLVVKLNVEGAECDAVLGTPPSAWSEVDEVFVETHPWARCGADELSAHLAAGGLTPAAGRHPLVLRLRRAATPAGAPRSDPT
jgi:FkbM family methyltransferase